MVKHSYFLNSPFHKKSKGFPYFAELNNQLVQQMLGANVSIQQDWKKWVGKVLGSEEDIQTALEQLPREPKNADELQDIIFKVRKQKMEQIAQDSTETGYDLPD